MTYWFPTEKLGIVISCNNGDARSGELASKVADIYLDGKLKPATVLKEMATGEAARAFAGVYRDEGGAYFELAFKDGKLATVRPPWTLAQLSPGIFVLPTDPDGMRFTFDPDGNGFNLAPEGDPDRHFERVEKGETNGAAAAAFAGSYQSPEVTAPIAIRQDGGLKLKVGELPELPLFLTAPDRLWAPDLGLELVFSRDASGQPNNLLLNAGRARGLKYARAAS